LIESISDGCKQAHCVLLGGETAEMPDVYPPNAFDIAGFAVGAVELGQQIEGLNIINKDVVIGLKSSGIHSNGYALVRRIINESKCDLEQTYNLDEPLKEVLLRPTRIYVDAVHRVLEKYSKIKAVTGMAHITGGGLKENIERILPPNVDVIIDRNLWDKPPIFEFIQTHGVERKEMYQVFNMGIGFVIIAHHRFVDGIMDKIREAGEKPVVIGEVTRGTGRVVLKH